MDYETETIHLTSQNATDSKHIFRQNYSMNMSIGEGDEIAVASCYLYFSWRNVTTLFNNRTVSYYWPTDGSTNLVTFTEGFYLVSDLNNYIHQIMLANGHYLVDENGKNVFYLELQENYNVYGITATFKPLPSSLPPSWSNPASLDLSVPNARTTQLMIGSNNFGSLIGFNVSTSYPATPQSSVTMISSPTVPHMSPVTSCKIACNMVNSANFNTFGNVIKSFGVGGVKYGDQFKIEPPQPLFYKCVGGSYPMLQISFHDQFYQPLGLLDTNVDLELIIRRRKRKNLLTL